MAQAATVHTFALQLADADRNVYTELALRVARHPSETAEFMLARVLAYCLEYTDGIAFTEGVAATDEPALVVRDLTGQLRAWIEVGLPDPERLHRGAKRAERAAVYVHRDPAPWLAQVVDRRVHRAAEIPVHVLDPEFLRAAAAVLDRRNDGSVSVSGRVIYLELNGQMFSAEVRSLELG
jgi:uncharacterized protein YaeQ